jgi:hypothetical protein
MLFDNASVSFVGDGLKLDLCSINRFEVQQQPNFLHLINFSFGVCGGGGGGVVPVKTQSGRHTQVRIGSG